MMQAFFSFIFFLLLPLAIGVLIIYLSIDLFEYLKKYHPMTYKQMSFESLFGMSGDNSLIYLIKPQAYVRFLMAPVDLQDQNIKTYKQRIKLGFIGLLGLFVIYLLWNLIF
jgi:Na+/proline symporter